MKWAFSATAVLFASFAGLLSGAHPAAALDPLDPSRPCSVFDGAPCTPSHCGVFGAWPCVPALPLPGGNLRLNVQNRNGENGRGPERTVDSIQDLFAALRACWEPPLAEPRREMQMSVRFSFKRTGELVAPPRVTYTSAGIDPETRRLYQEAITAALARCTPMPFSRQMGAAIAGRPIAIRFIDDRIEGETR